LMEELTWNLAQWRYPEGVPEKVQKLLTDELALIAELDYARYFLTVHDIVRFAEDHGILCQGRGSAANSAVCYALGITAVDPGEHELLFARFISSERREPPDIDVDFEHERREEVIQHIYKRYGRERAGIAATVITYRPRSAIREVGKVFGLTEDVTARLAGTVWGSWGDEIPDSQLRGAGIDPDNPLIRRAVGFARRLLGFPRHLSQHVGGFVLSRGRLDETVPIGNAAMEDRTFIEWDKDDIDTLGLMKVDVLGLGMLTCIRKSFELLRAHAGLNFDLAAEELEAEGVEVRTVRITDDVASAGKSERHLRRGVAGALLSAAVACAQDHGAVAIEGIPFADTTRPTGADAMVGTQSLFEQGGFAVDNRPSARRVVMRKELP
jgi:error-prone DNA polymerase